MNSVRFLQQTNGKNIRIERNVPFSYLRKIFASFYNIFLLLKHFPQSETKLQISFLHKEALLFKGTLQSADLMNEKWKQKRFYNRGNTI